MAEIISLTPKEAIINSDARIGQEYCSSPFEVEGWFAQGNLKLTRTDVDNWNYLSRLETPLGPVHTAHFFDEEMGVLRETPEIVYPSLEFTLPETTNLAEDFSCAVQFGEEIYIATNWIGSTEDGKTEWLNIAWSNANGQKCIPLLPQDSQVFNNVKITVGVASAQEAARLFAGE